MMVIDSGQIRIFRYAQEIFSCSLSQVFGTRYASDALG